MRFTTAGFALDAAGLDARAARTCGIRAGLVQVAAFAISGAFAGLAGGVEIMGIHHRLMNGFSAAVGFDAMAVALLGGLHPVGVTIASLFFAALRVGANTMQRTVQVPSALVNVIQGLVILFAGAMEHLFRPSVQAIFASVSPRSVGMQSATRGGGA